MPFEDWESDQATSKIKWIILAAVLLVALSASVVAVYQIVSPPSDPVTVTSAATLSKPTVNATEAVIGNTVTITGQLSDHLEGVQIWFQENSVDIGSDFTDDTGTATYNRVLSTAGTFTYSAHCVHP